MKNLLSKLLAFALLLNIISPTIASAQWDDWTYDNTPTYNTYTNPSTGYVDTTCYGCSTGNTGTSGSWDNWTYDNTPTYNTYTSPSTGYVDTTCYGCDTGNTSNTGSWDNWTYDNTPTYNTYTNPSTGYVDTTCYGCSTGNGNSGSSWGWDNSAAASIPATTYANPSYVTPSYVTPANNSSWGWNTPATTYTYPTNTYITPTYTYPTNTYVTPTYVTPTNNNSSWNWNSNTNTNTNTNTTNNSNWSYWSNTNTNVNNSVNNSNNTSNVYNNTLIDNSYCNGNNNCNTTINNTTNNTTNNSNTIQYQTCWNGTVIPVTSTCPNQTRVCQNGTVVPVSQTCMKTCANGSVVAETATCYKVCPNGYSYPEYQTCPSTIQYQTCSNGTVIPVTSTCPNQYQTCWNGSVILLSQVCPTQYKTCPNGTTVLLSQVCPSVQPQTQVCWDGSVIYTYQTCPAQTVNNHRVVTTIPTYITNSSAYCNGIAMIYNGVRTNGYFEYGPTQSLGYNTSSAYIGNSVSTSYSAPISGLSAGKTYYCRAVITNANGTYKGEIMSFTTKSNPIVYVKPTVKATPVVTKKKTTYTYTPAKTSYKCIDVSGATDTIDSNEKVMEVTLEKQSGTYNIGETVLWKLTYKNIGRIMASNVNVKLVLPPELTYVSSTMGSVDANNVVNISVGALTALNESSVIITTKVRDVATVGKTIVVTGYASYDLNTTSKTVVSDEVSSYVIGTILPALDDADSKTNNKTSINNTKSDTFLPNTLVEWLALIAILVILAVLIRNVYLAYKGDDHGHH